MATIMLPNRCSLKPDRNSVKLKINCKERINSNPLTKDWLELIGKIEHKSHDTKIYRGLLDKKNNIVAKIARVSLKDEYENAEKLELLKLPTFITYNCIFTCLDDFSSLNNLTKEVCKGEGAQISVIIMPFINEGRIEDFKWVRANFAVMKNVMKHVCLSLLYAKRVLGFVHRDIHLGNILMKQSKRKEICYGEFGNLEVIGYIPLIMDFDKSVFVEKYDKYVYEDIFKFISLMTNGCNVKFEASNIREFLGKQLIPSNRSIDTTICKTLCDYIDNLEVLYVSSEILKVPIWLK